jgi:hypothetical protein
MRARESLAHLLWAEGERDEAIGHLQDMLRLNPEDNQGLRHTLCGWLPSEGRDEELAGLLAQYEGDPTAWWAYTHVLAAFRKHGDAPAIRELLDRATERNKRVPDYLTGKKGLPAKQPDMYSLGSEEEAILCAAGLISGWNATPGAIAWLRGDAHAKEKPGSQPSLSLEPPPLVKKRLHRLPLTAEVWQADARQFGPRVEEGGELFQPWLTLVTSRTDGLVLSQSLSLEPPSAEDLWDRLVEAMERPLTKRKHRPAVLQVLPHDRWNALLPHLKEVGIRLVFEDELDHIDFVLDELMGQLHAEGLPGLLSTDGVEPENLVRFYQAAAAFYRLAPWKGVGDDVAIQIDCDQIEGGPWYALIIGRSGMACGLTLYDNLRTVKKLWSSGPYIDRDAEDAEALTILFVNKLEVPDSDLDTVENLDLEVAGPDAHPWVFHKERGMNIRSPMPWENRLLEACLRALPRFMANRRTPDRTEFRTIVNLGSESLELALAWFED